MMLDWQMRLMTLEAWLDGASDTIAEYCEELGIEKPDTGPLEWFVGWLRAELERLGEVEGPVADVDLPF